MSIRLLQIRNSEGARELVFTRNRGAAWRLKGISSTFALAQRAIEDRVGLVTAIAEHDSGEFVDLEAAFAQGRVMVPIDHPDPRICWSAAPEGRHPARAGSTAGRRKARSERRPATCRAACVSCAIMPDCRKAGSWPEKTA